MTEQIQCGSCNDFVERVLGYYQPLLSRHGFQFDTCSARDGGRDLSCSVVFTGPRSRLMFVLSDGAEATAISARDATPPPNGWSLRDGDNGWYSAIGLIEYKSGQRLMSRKLADAFGRGERDYFEWESALVTEWLERLAAMFTPDQVASWQPDFAKYRSTRRYD
ncbi:MAG TPA: hypothetical protein VGL99_21250 [Chloroflexota bacterium]